jgi:N-acetylglutamate synthase-like GNAT family acetyltransferase
MRIEAFEASQAEELSALIGRVLLLIISKDYAPAYVAALLEEFTPANIRIISRQQHRYVAIEDGHIVGTASLASYGPPQTRQYYGTSVFVAPEYHVNGIGRELMRRIEIKASELGAARLFVRAAVGARGFYRKLGYAYQDPSESPDERGNYVMEKPL